MFFDELTSCELCPRKCAVNRNVGQLGACRATNEIKIGRSSLHFWEEPSISGMNGSGTVFFSGCNLGCVFCQNYKISTENCGKIITPDELSEMFLELQSQGAHNINLVTPTHYICQIAYAIKRAKENGLVIPIVYNSGGYESVDALRMLAGLIDVYMPDLKYKSDKYAIKYSSAPDYFNVAAKAIREMYEQVGKNTFDENGIMTKGVLVRHLMLPGLIFDSKRVIDYLYNTYGDKIYISLMSQYTPMQWVEKYPELNRKVSHKYYQALVDYAIQLGVKNAYIQDGEAASESFVPEFYG